MNNVLNGMVFYSTGKEPAGWKNQVNAPLFKKTFNISEESPASLIIGATGFYELYLNGERITKGYLAPYISNPDQTLFFDRYDLEGRLKKGENTLCVLLGNGAANPFSGEVWGHNKQNIGPALALLFECTEISFTAKEMMWVNSPLIFDDLRAGVLCDNTYRDEEPPRKTVKARQPLGERRFTTCEPIREIRRIKARSIRQGAIRDYRIRDGFKGMLYEGDTVMGRSALCGGYIYDFGENNSGIPCLKIKAKRGQRIELQFCELMFEGFADYINVDIYPDGCAQRDVYICSGEGEEEFIPPFTYHGFRYCYVYGIDEKDATDELLEFIVIHNDVKVCADLCASDGISNKIFAACRRSDESNLMNIITDCPTREKNGWTGDAAISAEHYLLNLGIDNCIYDYTACIRNAQDEKGRFPLVVPSSRKGEECPIWDSALAFLTYYAYKYRGRIDIVKENADSIFKNLAFHLSKRDERGICDYGLGDWLPPGLEGGEYNSPLGFSSTATLLEMCQKTESLMRLLGKEKEEKQCRDWSLELRKAIRDEYVVGCTVTAGKSEKYISPLYRPCQSSQALALYVGIFDKDEETCAAEVLCDMISEADGAFDCGFLGLRAIFTVLSKFGYGDLAYKMITRPEHPSYANLIYRGETTVCERFSPPGERMGSHNHHFMADVSAWYIRDLLGIHVNPHFDDPNHILIDPDFISSIDQCEGTYRALNGEIHVCWKRENGKILLETIISGDVTVEFGKSTRDAVIKTTYLKK